MECNIRKDNRVDQSRISICHMRKPRLSSRPIAKWEVNSTQVYIRQ